MIRAWSKHYWSALPQSSILFESNPDLHPTLCLSSQRPCSISLSSLMISPPHPVSQSPWCFATGSLLLLLLIFLFSPFDCQRPGSSPVFLTMLLLSELSPWHVFPFVHFISWLLFCPARERRNILVQSDGSEMLESRYPRWQWEQDLSWAKMLLVSCIFKGGLSC